MTSDFCRDISLEAAEPISGTAARVETWILVQCEGRWSKDALGESSIPDEIKSRLNEYKNSIPDLRIQLIRRDVNNNGITVYVVNSKDGAAAVFEFNIERYDQLVDIDIREILSSPEKYSDHKSPHPLYLICTHGAYDRCCAKYGLTVFNEFRSVAQDRVWQTTHVGGHRFAANVVCLPHGFYYGRVGGGDAAAIVEGYESGHLSLKLLRGRSSYPKEVQAADCFLREKTGETAIDAYRVLNVAGISDGDTEVEFASSHDKTKHRVVVGKEYGEFRVKTKCADNELSNVVTYRLLEYSKK